MSAVGTGGLVGVRSDADVADVAGIVAASFDASFDAEAEVVVGIDCAVVAEEIVDLDSGVEAAEQVAVGNGAYLEAWAVGKDIVVDDPVGMDGHHSDFDEDVDIDVASVQPDPLPRL